MANLPDNYQTNILTNFVHLLLTVDMYMGMGAGRHGHEVLDHYDVYDNTV